MYEERSRTLDASLPYAEPATEQIVMFRIDGQSFGVDVTRVREIRGWQPVTPLPDAEDFVLGILNLRGLVVSVYDLRAKFRMPATAVTNSHVVIIVDIEDRTIGLVADSVTDIVSIGAGELRASPNETELIRQLVVKPDSITALLCLPGLLH